MLPLICLFCSGSIRQGGGRVGNPAWQTCPEGQPSQQAPGARGAPEGRREAKAALPARHTLDASADQIKPRSEMWYDGSSKRENPPLKKEGVCRAARRRGGAGKYSSSRECRRSHASSNLLFTPELSCHRHVNCSPLLSDTSRHVTSRRRSRSLAHSKHYGHWVQVDSLHRDGCAVRGARCTRHGARCTRHDALARVTIERAHERGGADVWGPWQVPQSVLITDAER